MLTRYFPLPVKFFCSIIYTHESVYQKIKNIFQKKFGAIDLESDIIDFNFTDYYYPEMGKPLLRRFIVFKKLQDPGRFAEIKLFSIKVEKKFAHAAKRTANIDPGYLDQAKLVLTTTKDFYHRIYLGKGIYAEVTMYYRDGDFCTFPTTYPDYRRPDHKRIFLAARETYREQIKNAKKK